MSDKGEALSAVLAHYGANARGQTGMASCVLHADRTPSMSFNLRTGLWNCHSCGHGGDAFSLVETKEGLGFVEAKAFVEQLGVTVARRDQEEEHVVGSVYGGRHTTKTRKGASTGGYKPSWRR